MKLGEDIVAVEGGLAVYAKLTATAFYALKCRKLLGEFHSSMQYAKGTLPKKIKIGNKFLKRHKLDELAAISDDDIEDIKKSGHPPVGALLCSVD